MYEHQRKTIEERFECKAFGFYGQAEVLVSAVECPEGGHYHLTMLDGILEIMDRNGEPVESGEKGFVVATSLHNKAMPLIRYRLGDYTGYMEENCDCKIKLPCIYPVEAKNDDFVITPSGRTLSPSIFTFPLKYSHGIIEAQIIQSKADEVILRIVKDEERYTEKDEKELLNSIKGILDPDMEVKIEYTKEIHQTRTFKKRFVISHLSKEVMEKVLRGEGL